MTILHTDFLVHWTGKDFHVPINPLDDNIRNKYVSRLIDILKYGFLMQKNEEESERIHDIEKKWIQASISRTCFTEIKLSLAKKHAQTYGNLGIGVDREYVLDRYGNPVFYVTNGDRSNVASCARKVRDFLAKKDTAMLREFEVLLGYFKKMGEQNSRGLIYYDELEWRITHLERLERENRITSQDKETHICRIALAKEEVKVLVFPDEKTKVLALGNSDILSLIDNPICLTMDDCENL